MGFVVALAAGCGRNDVQVYRVAKEPAAQPPAAQGALPPGHPDVSGAAPAVGWKLPAGWQEVAPGQMRLASFRVSGADGKQADISVVPLPGMAGGDLANVNRWRGQVGLAPVAEEELPKLAEPLEIAGQPGQLYDLAGQNPGSGEKNRLLVAVSRREGTAWFFKMLGNDELVAQQKPVFVEFLKSLTFAPGAQAGLPPSHPPIGQNAAPGPGLMSTAAAAAGPAENKPAWVVPAGWQETAGGQFLVAKFLLAEKDSQAAVNVSTSTGDGGGLLNNVNRWRRQLGLGDLAAGDLAAATKPLEVPGGQATLVEMNGADPKTGQPTRLLAAVVPQSGQSWFYKMMGSDGLVAAQKEAFIKFVQSVKY